MLVVMDDQYVNNMSEVMVVGSSLARCQLAVIPVVRMMGKQDITT